MTQPHDRLAGIRQATLESALVNHERRSLGITEDQLRTAIWSAANEFEIFTKMRDLVDAARARMKPTIEEKPAGAPIGEGTAR
jgi:hypothetical protein